MIKGYVTGDAEVVRHFDQGGPRLRDELKHGIGRLVLILQRKVKVEKLSGQVLNVRTGRLRRSIAQDVSAQGDKVTGVVSTAVDYARPHEYSFKGPVTIRAHMRTVKQAFGKPISPRDVQVKAHTANINLPERSFLRSALRELEGSGRIRVELEEAALRALR